MALPELEPEDLRPYASFAVLRYTGPDRLLAVPQAMKALRTRATKAHGTRRAAVTGSGVDPRWLAQYGIPSNDDRLMLLDAFTFRVERTPNWATAGSGFEHISDELCVVFLAGDFVAVHCPKFLVEPIQRWLDRPPRPPFVRVPGPALRQAFLQGEARGLWLRGTHARTRSKPDTKTMSGPALEDALDPHEDGSFALASGRAALTATDGRLGNEGTVGTTPKKAWVWLKQTDSLATFVDLASGVISMVEDAIAAPVAELGFPELADEVESLAEVLTAYEAFVSSPDQLAMLPEVSNDEIERAALLQDAILDVEGEDRNAHFTLSVGTDGAEVGRLRFRPQLSDGHVAFDVGVVGTPSDAPALAEIRDLLGRGDLLNIHYMSGHRLSDNAIARPNEEHLPFKRWSFHDFSGFLEMREKPVEPGSQGIHDAIAEAGDVSLFAWIVRSFGSGHLTCDDGANEVADFVHLGHDGLLTLLHVKGASAGRHRRVSTGAYELVIGQAIKNLRYVRPRQLIPALDGSPLARPATWLNGKRTSDRSLMLDALRMRTDDKETRVVVVQPHLSQTTHRRLRALENSGGESVDLRRLHLVENLLQSARRTFVGINAELDVWAAAD